MEYKVWPRPIPEAELWGILRNCNKTSEKGFLLIEALLYLFLFSMIIVGSLSIFFSILDNSQKLSTENLVVQEAGFMLRKIDNLIASAQEIITPADPADNGAQSEILKLKTGGNALEIITIRLENDFLVLEKDSGDSQPLNNSRLEMGDLNFKRVTFGNSSVFGIKTSFKINDREFSSFQIRYE